MVSHRLSLALLKFQSSCLKSRLIQSNCVFFHIELDCPVWPSLCAPGYGAHLHKLLTICSLAICYQDQDILKLVYLQIECSIPKFMTRPSHLGKHQTAKEKGTKIKTRLLGKLPVSEISVKAAGKEIQNWVRVEKWLLFSWHQKEGLRDLIQCENPRAMSLIELLREKVMLFTCKTLAFSRKVSTINLDNDNVSQE